MDSELATRSRGDVRESRLPRDAARGPSGLLGALPVHKVSDEAPGGAPRLVLLGPRRGAPPLSAALMHSLQVAGPAKVAPEEESCRVWPRAFG